MRRIALLLALAGPVLATSTEEVTVKCLVCDNGFKAEHWNSTNSFGGQDRDFCQHAAGGQVFIIACWTCPRCGYTGFADDFDAEKAPKDLIEKLRKENPLRPAEPIDPKCGDSRKIAPWIRYDLLLQVQKLQPDASADALASICLRAAQTQRFDWEGMEGSEFGKRIEALIRARWQALAEEKRDKRKTNPYDTDILMAGAMESDAANPNSGLDAAARLAARAAAALLFKTRGEDADAARVLDALGAAELPADVKAFVADVRARIDRERKYQLLAIPWFEKHLAEGKPEGQEAIAIRYLLGVLQRRTGDPKRAVTLLEPLLAERGIPDGFLEWIKDELAKAK